MADDIDVSDLSEEELNNINNESESDTQGDSESGAGGIEMFGDDDSGAEGDSESGAGGIEMFGDDDSGSGGMVDDDMLADMLDQASDTEESDTMVDDDMLADMLDQASDTEESDTMVDDDMLADMLDQASDTEVSEPQLDSEGNPMDDDMAAMWGDALGEQASGEGDFSGGKVVNSDSVDYQKVNMPELNVEYGGAMDLDIIMDVPITISMEVGRTKAPIRNLLQLNQGSVIELDRLAGESLDVLVNGCLIAHGEVVVVNEKFGIRLTDIISVDERVKKITV